MTDPGFTVGDVVRKLRKEKKWSIRKLAAESGVGRMTISDIERNRSNYQKETLEALAGVFGKTAAELETLVASRPARRTSDTELPAEWVALTRRIMHLTRQAQGAIMIVLLALEEAGAVRPPFDSGDPPVDTAVT